MKKHLFNLPDGSTLKFAPHWQTGPQIKWYMSFDDPRVWEASKGPKAKLYRVNLLSSQTNLNVVAADIDRLPDGFASFDSLYAYLSAIFSENQAIVARSASNKVKVFFLVETPTMSPSIARDTLERLFSFDLSVFDCIDISANALRVTNLNYSVLLALSSKLPSLNPIQAVMSDEEGAGDSINTNTTDSSPTRPYRSYQGPLSTIMKSEENLSHTKKGVLRILLECKSLVKSAGFCISTRKIAGQLGVSQQLISRYRKYFVRRGWLKPHHDRSFIPGKRAKRFVASGDLASAIEKLHPIVSDLSIPTSIPDTEWNKTLGSLVGKLFYTHSLGETMEKIKTIKGSHLGDRLSQAEGWYKWYSKKRSPVEVNSSNTKRTSK